MNNIYTKALEVINSGLFLQMEGSFGRYYVDNYIKTGIIKATDEKGEFITDGYGRQFHLKKFVIDWERIDFLEEHDPWFMDSLIYEVDNGWEQEVQNGS